MGKGWLIPFIYVLILLVDIAYTFQISLQSSVITLAELTRLALIMVVVGGLWALENVAIIYAKEARAKEPLMCELQHRKEEISKG